VNNIYLVERCYDDEGCTVLDIFSTIEQAIAYDNDNIGVGDIRYVYSRKIDGGCELLAIANRGQELEIPNDHHE
jgi:hypothetical protein